MSNKPFNNIPSRENFLKKKPVNENVVRQGNVFKVYPIVDVKESDVNAFIRKIKEEKGNEVMDNWAPANIAEAMVNYVWQKFLNVDNIPVSVITGDEEPVDTELEQGVQGAQPQPIAQAQPTQMVQPQVQPQPVEITEPAAEPLSIDGEIQ